MNLRSILFCMVLLLIAANASAQIDPFEFEVYPYQTEGKGVVELELVSSSENWHRGPKQDLHSSNEARVDSPVWHLIQAMNTLVGPDGHPIVEYSQQVYPSKPAVDTYWRGPLPGTRRARDHRPTNAGDPAREWRYCVIGALVLVAAVLNSRVNRDRPNSPETPLIR